VCESDVVALSGRADQTDRIAKAITGGVDFGAQTAPGLSGILCARP
jgi:hypothetical protein